MECFSVFILLTVRRFVLQALAVDILPQCASQCHIHGLNSPADPECGLFRPDHFPEERHFKCITQIVNGSAFRQLLFSVYLRVDIHTAGKQETVKAFRIGTDHVRVFRKRQNHRCEAGNSHLLRTARQSLCISFMQQMFFTISCASNRNFHSYFSLSAE